MKKLYGVIGDPIAHSMSPAMHNELLKHYGIDGYYHPFHVKEENLGDAIKGLKAIGISGFNVTLPHKETIMPYLDKLDPLASAIGAVNTVVNEEGMLVGYNTDGSGFLRSLQGEIPHLQEHRILIIGAGGAARALFFTLASKGVRLLDLCNRTISKAEHIVHDCPFTPSSKVLGLEEAQQALAHYDIVIQTTSIGMSPRVSQTPLSLQHLRADALVSDIIYTPLETAFLREARKRGAKTQNGIGMFVYQGALAFEKWTGIFPDTEMMKVNVRTQLGG